MSSTPSRSSKRKRETPRTSPRKRQRTTTRTPTKGSSSKRPSSKRLSTRRSPRKTVSSNKPVYEVEKILNDKKLKNGEVEYFVKWRNYPKSKATWEPRSNLTNCEQVIKDYLKSQSKRSSDDSDEELYIVESVLDGPLEVDGTQKYLVKWKGYKKSEATWEPKSNLTGCEEILEKYEKKKQEEEDYRKVSKKTYVVEKLLKKRVSGGETEYLVKWKNYKTSEATWEPSSHLQHCKELIKEFNSQSKSSKRKLSPRQRSPRKRARKETKPEFYEVEEILDHKVTKDGDEYFVKWKGYNLSSASWEPVEHLKSCQEALERFQNAMLNAKTSLVIKSSSITEIEEMSRIEKKQLKSVVIEPKLTVKERKIVIKFLKDLKKCLEKFTFLHEPESIDYLSDLIIGLYETNSHFQKVTQVIFEPHPVAEYEYDEGVEDFGVSEDALNKLATLFPHLVDLTLATCSTTVLPKSIGRKLTSLEIVDCPLLSGEALADSVGRSKVIRRLSVHYEHLNFGTLKPFVIEKREKVQKFLQSDKLKDQEEIWFK